MALARAERKKQRKRDRAARKATAPPTPIILPEFISIGNLASALRVKIDEFVERMVSLGFEETNSDYVLDAETAGLIATEFNYDPIIDRGEAEDLVARPPAEDKSLLPPRPPVVTIMGHVDHGKTTLLDWLRKSSVAASEHGGITQHIGAFTVPMPSGKIITFLDTPGHAAFLSMRQRGANVTDIVILVVAADDSVKPQTVEAIKHAQTAKVPMIVAINKIDKEGSNVERVKQDLARHGVDVEDFGGDTQVVCVSGKTGQGMDELEDAAVALADIIDMRAETDGPAEGWILEATTKKAGRVATVLVRRGTIYPGSVIVAGSTWSKIRSLKNEAGAQIDSAGPGTPVEIDGWREQPEAGDEVLEAPDEQKAKDVVNIRLERAETTQMAVDMVAVNETRRMEQEKREREEHVADSQDVENVDPPTGIKEVFFIIKGDVSGSVEAVLNSVSALGNEEVRAHILRFGVGPVSEFDVEHAAVAKGHIISFNTPVDPNITRMAEAAGVSILDQNIIYRLVDDVKAKLSEQLAPSITSRVLGEAEIAQVFDINIKGRVTVPIAGCKVRNGVVTRNGKVRVLRERVMIYDGSLSSFKNQKKDVTEMRKGGECGLGFEGFTDFKVGDQVQCYEEKVEKRSLGHAVALESTLVYSIYILCIPSLPFFKGEESQDLKCWNNTKILVGSLCSATESETGIYSNPAPFTHDFTYPTHPNTFPILHIVICLADQSPSRLPSLPPTSTPISSTRLWLSSSISSTALVWGIPGSSPVTGYGRGALLTQVSLLRLKGHHQEATGMAHLHQTVDRNTMGDLLNHPQGLPSVSSNAYVHGNPNAPPPPPQSMQSFGNGAPQGYSFQYSACTGRRKALLIGINYFGQRGQLRGCINDVKNMSTYLNENFGYAREDMVILTDDQQNPMSQPTKANILRAMHWLVKDAKPNDSLFFHYSGHGGQTPDLDGDEDDGYDEVIYPVDFRTAGHITDDEMHRILVKSLQPGVRLTAIFDSCHSGSALDLPYLYSTQGVLKEPNLAKEAGQGLLGIVSAYARGDLGGVASTAMGFFKKATTGDAAYTKALQTKTSPADVIMWSGSKDTQTSQDAQINNEATGAMSWAFITALKKNPQQSYVQLLNSIRDELASKYTQKPQLSCSHPLSRSS
ncbi:MAG: hypothetical protein Q9187_007130 [Circinaria calcarea]